VQLPFSYALMQLIHSECSKFKVHWYFKFGQNVQVAHGGTVGWGTVLQARMSRVYWHIPSGHTMALRLTWPLTEMSTRNISWWV